MSGSLKLFWILVLVLMLRPVVIEKEMVQAAEERKYENKKVKEMAPACDENECRVECEHDGYDRGRCFGQACVCFDPKKMEAKEGEQKLVLKKDYRELCTADPPCIAACKKDGFCSGQCLEYICYCLPNCTATHPHNHFPSST